MPELGAFRPSAAKSSKHDCRDVFWMGGDGEAEVRPETWALDIGRVLDGNAAVHVVLGEHRGRDGDLDVAVVEGTHLIRGSRRRRGSGLLQARPRGGVEVRGRRGLGLDEADPAQNRCHCDGGRTGCSSLPSLPSRDPSSAAGQVRGERRVVGLVGEELAETGFDQVGHRGSPIWVGSVLVAVSWASRSEAIAREAVARTVLALIPSRAAMEGSSRSA